MRLRDLELQLTEDYQASKVVCNRSLLYKLNRAYLNNRVMKY